MRKPLAIELYCGRFGWGKGLVAEGWRVLGFDILHEDYHGDVPEGCQLVLQDVRTLHGAQFKDVDLIVASPPCQFFSRMAMPFRMPWTQAEFERRRNLGLELFWSCFRIQHQASEAAGRYIPMIVENVRGANAWTAPSRYNYGSFYLWGDIPILMPRPLKAQKFNPDGTNHRTGFTSRDCGSEGTKFGGGWWNDSTNNLIRKASSKSSARKAASAAIAEIPLPLAQHIARVFKP